MVCKTSNFCKIMLGVGDIVIWEISHHWYSDIVSWHCSVVITFQTKHQSFFQIQFNRLSNLTCYQMTCMVDFVVLFLVPFLIDGFSKPKIRNDSKNKTTKSTMHVIWQFVKYGFGKSLGGKRFWVSYNSFSALTRLC